MKTVYRIMSTILALAMVFSIYTSAHASSAYYVSATGSDNNPGTAAQPFLTIQKAANIATAGSTIIVEPGTYNQRVYVTISGTAGAPITYEAAQFDNSVIMNGFTVKADYIAIKGFYITNTPNNDQDGIGIFAAGKYCDIENNYVYYATRGGIVLQNSANNCTVSNNKLQRNSQFGIEVRGNNNLVRGNEIWQTIQYHPAWINPPSYVDADGIHFFGNGNVFRGNYIHDISYTQPENINPHIDCFQTWQDSNYTAASNTIIAKNICINPEAKAIGVEGTGFQIHGAMGGGIVIRNNLVTAFEGAVVGASNGVTFVNNDIRNHLNANLSLYPEGFSSNNSTNIVVQNNIFYNEPGQLIYVTGSAVQGGHNLMFRSDGQSLTSSSTYNHSGDLWGVNPLFVNPSAGDYHLQAGSPAIDVGINLGSFVPNDFEGNPRPQGAGFDIGAFER